MKKKILIILALVGIFLCGAVVGGVVALRYSRTLVQTRAVEHQLNSPQWRRATDHLGLSPEQRGQIRDIILKYMKEQQAARRANQAVMDAMYAEIKTVLTPEQREKFEKERTHIRDNERSWQRWYRDTRSKRPDGPGGPPPPPPPEPPDEP